MRRITALVIASCLIATTALALGKFTFCAPEGCVWVADNGSLTVDGYAYNLTNNGDATSFSFTCEGAGTCYKISENGKVLEIWGTAMRGPGSQVFINAVSE